MGGGIFWVVGILGQFLWVMGVSESDWRYLLNGWEWVDNFYWGWGVMGEGG